MLDIYLLLIYLLRTLNGCVRQQKLYNNNVNNILHNTV